ncbi:DNA polymerase III subunit delta' [Actinomycetaceae bacterium TAE3-ERU4]|nr:DNA polymerase III subunit delta' [Actinomycetaceae bacterium TAE3-ERU4]
MSVWDSLIAQDQAVTTLQKAALGARARVRKAWGQELDSISEDAMRAMTHAWLVTGPPGSGRSNAARAFAAALECEGEVPGCGICEGCKKTMSGEHPDVLFLTTEKVTISIDEVRQLVVRAQTAPSGGRWRVIVIEDADRMLPLTTNTLLKAIEEPPERTVWILCTPSPQDVLTTIRSRCRSLNLLVPPPQMVAQLLLREGSANNPQVALEAALAAQSHIGRARALVKSEASVRKEIRARIARAVSARSAGQAVLAAQDFMQAATDEAKDFKDNIAPLELNELRRALGMEKGTRESASQRAQIKEKIEEQKSREKRIVRDNLDLTMIDLLSFYRDVLIVQTGGEVALLNSDLESQVRFVADNSQPQITLARMDAISRARARLRANVSPKLVLEAMVISFIPPFRPGEVFV